MEKVKGGKVVKTTFKKEEKQCETSKELATAEKVIKEKSLMEKVAELKEERNKELSKAFEEISAICRKYSCALDADVIINSQGVFPQVKIVDTQLR